MIPIFLVLDASVETSCDFLCNATLKARLVVWMNKHLLFVIKYRREASPSRIYSSCLLIEKLFKMMSTEQVPTVVFLGIQ